MKCIAEIAGVIVADAGKFPELRRKSPHHPAFSYTLRAVGSRGRSAAFLLRRIGKRGFRDEPYPIVVTRVAVHRTMTRGGRSIVVPLDGSKLAEAALRVALDLAGLPRAEVTFLQVILPPDRVIGDGKPTTDQQGQSEKCRVRDYLDSIRSRPEWQVCDVEVAVEMGKPAETILEFADARKAAYIVMSTHGRSGVQRWVFGSVADTVLRAARTTVVLVRAGPSDGV